MVLLAVLLVSLALMAGWMWRLSHDRPGRQVVAERTEDSVDDRLQDVWEHVGRLHGEHAWHVGEWMQRADDAIAQVANRQRQLDQRLDAVEEWVRYWAGQAKR